MQNFWDFSAWGSINLVAVLLISLLIANVIKRSIKFLRVSLIPTSVLGGMLLLIFAGIYDLITGDILFETAYFGKDGYATLETITYHTLALGFIASSFKTANGKLSKKRTVEIFNTGVTTVSTYLLQAVVGFGITMIAALVMKGFFEAAAKLRESGAVSRFTVITDKKQMQKPVTAFILLVLQYGEAVDKLMKTVEDDKDVLECYAITGEYDYIIKICASSVEALEEKLLKLKKQKGVIKSHTMLSLMEHKFEASVLPDNEE